MLAVSPDEPGLGDLLRNARMRPDLTSAQLHTIEEFWSTWSVRRAQRAFATNPKSAFAILIDAGSAYPQNRDIHAALASLYLKRHDKEKALEVFRTWGMAGTEAGDYRMATGAALSAHKDTLAGQFLRRGLESFPNAPDLIHMNARQDIMGGDYAEAERELESTLVPCHAACLFRDVRNRQQRSELLHPKRGIQPEVHDRSNSDQYGSASELDSGLDG